LGNKKIIKFDTTVIYKYKTKNETIATTNESFKKVIDLDIKNSVLGSALYKNSILEETIYKYPTDTIHSATLRKHIISLIKLKNRLSINSRINSCLKCSNNKKYNVPNTIWIDNNERKKFL
jgi:hypothetical protein